MTAWQLHTLRLSKRVSLSYIWNGNAHVPYECALTDRREVVVLHHGGLVGLRLLPTHQQVMLTSTEKYVHTQNFASNEEILLAILLHLLTTRYSVCV